MVSWKTLAGPVLLLVLKLLRIQYDDPMNLGLIRSLYATTQALVFGTCIVIAYRICQFGDAESTITIKDPSNKDMDESQVTYKDYDMGQLKKFSQNFAMGLLMTVLIHYYTALVPALVLQTVSQPLALYDHALFGIYVMQKNENTDSRLKRPFTVETPPRFSFQTKKPQSQD